MKNSGLLNSDLIRIMSRLGHGDMVAVTDNGFPFPLSGATETVDLAVIRNLPGFMEVVRVIVEEYYIEGVIIADETREKSRHIIDELIPLLKNNKINGKEIAIRYIPHSEFKDLVLHGAERGEPIVSMIRTGEFTAYANIILVAGIPF